MKYPLDILDLNQKRIFRAGEKLWEDITNIKKGDIVNAVLAEKFIDCYGIHPSDLVFFLSIIGASIDMDPFYDILIERENRPKTIKLLPKQYNE